MLYSLAFILFITNSMSLNNNTFVYFNPDGNFKNITLIDQELKKLLPSVEIISVIKYSSFKSALKNRKPFGCISPLLNNQNIYAKQIVDGKSTFKKVIIVKKQHKISEKSRVAIINYGDETKKLIKEITGMNFKIVIKVQKDMDAIWSLKFGWADVAIVKKENFDSLFYLLSELIEVHDYTKDIPLAPVYLFKPEYEEKMKKILKNDKIKNLMELDNWILKSQKKINKSILITKDKE